METAHAFLTQTATLLIYTVLIMALLLPFVISVKSGKKAMKIVSERKIGMSPSSAFWYIFIHDLAIGIISIVGSLLLFAVILYYIV